MGGSDHNVTIHHKSACSPRLPRINTQIDPACAAAVRLCQFLGDRIAEARPNIDTEALAGAFQTLSCSSIAYLVDGEGKRRGQSVSGCHARLPRSG